MLQIDHICVGLRPVATLVESVQIRRISRASQLRQRYGE